MFQFHKVRLKEFISPLLLVVTVFQFHKVRLKAVIHLTSPSVATFQFHKVRLKVQQGEAVISVRQVSIP